MKSIEFVPATPELLERFYGARPPMTVRAVVAMQDDEMVSVFGVFRVKQSWVGFWDYPKTTVPAKHKRALVRGYRMVLDMVKSSRMPVYAYADPAIQKSEDMLRHMGMERHQGQFFVMGMED